MSGAATNAFGFDDYFERTEVNIFRLETFQVYGNSGEDPALAAFLAGEPHLITPGKREWITLVRTIGVDGSQSLGDGVRTITWM